MSDKPHVSVVLPTFNERDNIGLLITELLEHLRGTPVEIVVVDDDSPDRTWEVVEDIAGGDARVRLVRRIGRRGLTSAITDGFGESRGDIVTWMDCDLSMPPAVVPRLVEAIDRGNDLALGSRFVPGGSDVRQSWLGALFSRVINLFACLVLGWKVHDYTSGFIAARREVLERIPLRGDYGEYCIDLLHRARKTGFRLIEIPYNLVPRQRGVSKTATSLDGYLRRGTKYVATIVRLRFE